MATAQTLAVVDIPGLHHSPDAEDFADSRNVSNGLPQPERYLIPRSRTWASFLFAISVKAPFSMQGSGPAQLYFPCSQTQRTQKVHVS
ncbi:hypothetical protein BHE90_016065 [Fusarium euwallaceae]|uniref:Uncharacterized protein n=1 Tax=Fusarium euwallaceae TaxID=1147111 RepID=A0A430L1J2_9HYPO|nr:hypothetical protein BHE90_016065 [Fusarium euwallaceae]